MTNRDFFKAMSPFERGAVIVGAVDWALVRVPTEGGAERAVPPAAPSRRTPLSAAPGACRIPASRAWKAGKSALSAARWSGVRRELSGRTSRLSRFSSNRRSTSRISRFTTSVCVRSQSRTLSARH